MIRSRPIFAICSLALLGTAVYAQSVEDSLSRSFQRELKIREALDEETTLEFIECPLQDICNYISDSHEISVQIDKRALEGIGLDSDVPVTRNLRGVSLRSALNLILDEHELSWVVRHEVLLITTAAAANAKAFVRVHNVADLIVGDTTDGFAGALEAVLGGQASDDGPPSVRIVPYQHMLMVRGTEQGHREVAELLLKIRTSVQGPPQGVREAVPQPAARSKLLESMEDVRKREGQKPDSREKTKAAPPDPFGGDGSNPFGAPARPAKPAPKDDDPFAPDPFGEAKPAKSGEPKNPFADP